MEVNLFIEMAISFFLASLDPYIFSSGTLDKKVADHCFRGKYKCNNFMSKY